MPTYIYECTFLVPNEEFEATHSINEELTECIHCKEKGLPFDHKPKRLIAGGTAFVLKNGGWANEGYSKK